MWESFIRKEEQGGGDATASPPPCSSWLACHKPRRTEKKSIYSAVKNVSAHSLQPPKREDTNDEKESANEEKESWNKEKKPIELMGQHRLRRVGMIVPAGIGLADGK